MFKNYFKIAWRNLKRNKIYSLINILGLSIGLACAMLIILYVKDEVSYDRFHKNGNNIYRVVSQAINNKTGQKGNMDPYTGYLQGPRFSANVPEIRSFVRIQGGGIDIKKGTDVSSQGVLKVDSSFFSVFSFPLINGNPQTCLQQPNSVVISEDEAKKLFGSADVVGKTIMLRADSSFVPYMITAVSKRCPQNSSIKFDMLLPIKVSNQEVQEGAWFNEFLNTFVMLQPGANTQTVEAKMQRFYVADSKESRKVIEEKYGPMDWTHKYLLQPLTAMHLSKDLPAENGLSDSSNSTYSYILSCIALFILLIACINFVNLTVARSVKRAKEIGIRKVVGGDRKQLIFQFLGESFLLCFLSFMLAILIVKLILPTFNNLSNKALAISYLFDIRLVAGYIALFLITGLLAGFYPALILSGYNPVQTLYSRFILPGRNYLQKSLVVFQFALASFLIMATLVIYSQLNYLTTEKLGYDDTHLVTINKDQMKRSEVKLLRNELMKDPDIIGVAPRNGGRSE